MPDCAYVVNGHGSSTGSMQVQHADIVRLTTCAKNELATSVRAQFCQELALRVLCRLIPYLVGSVLDCFRPVIDFAVPPSHPDLHTAAVAAFMMSTCTLQHFALHFLAEVS